MGPIEALKASSRTTQGYKWNLFGIFIIFFGVAILGFILFVIGIIPASLTIGIGNALIYLYLSDNRKEPAKSESEVK